MRQDKRGPRRREWKRCHLSFFSALAKESETVALAIRSFLLLCASYVRYVQCLGTASFFLYIVASEGGGRSLS